MISLVHSTNTIGVTALTIAALFSASRRQRNWGLLATMLAAMAALIATNAHWTLHDAIRATMISHDLYGEHVMVQIAITSAAAVMFAVAGLWVLLRQHGPLRWASITTIALFALMMIQAVSIHRIDTVFSQSVGPIMVIGWLWIAGASIVIFAALFDRRASIYFTHSGKSYSIK